MKWNNNKENILMFIQSMTDFLNKECTIETYKIVMSPHPEKGPYETYEDAVKEFDESYGEILRDVPKGKEFYDRYIRVKKHVTASAITVILKDSEKEEFEYCVDVVIMKEDCSVPWHSSLDFYDIVEATNSISEIENIFNESKYMKFKNILNIILKK